MWILLAALVAVIAAAIWYWLSRRFGGGAVSSGGQACAVDWALLEAWNGSWTGLEIFSEHCSVKSAALGLDFGGKAAVRSKTRAD